MTIKKMTALFIMLIICMIVLYDVYAFVKGGTGATISWSIYEWSELSDAVPFGFGFVMGHLFWRMKKPKDTSEDFEKG